METINYQLQATDLLARFGIDFDAVCIPSKCPPWCKGRCSETPHGKRYVVTFSRPVAGGRPITYKLDFWNSYNDAKAGVIPTAYDVLSALTKSDPRHTGRLLLRVRV